MEKKGQEDIPFSFVETERTMQKSEALCTARNSLHATTAYFVSPLRMESAAPDLGLQIARVVASFGGGEGLGVKLRVPGLPGRDRTLDALSIRHIAGGASAPTRLAVESLQPRFASFVAGEVGRSASRHEMAFT